MPEMHRDPGPGTRAERRVHRRVHLSARAELRQGDATIPGICCDLSLGGLAIRSRDRVSLGETVQIWVELGSGAGVYTTGEVVRDAAGVLGLRFVSLDQRALTSILTHVAKA